MTREELEALSAEELRRLIADAAAVLAARCATSASTMPAGSGLFTFGSNEPGGSSSGAAGGFASGLFAPPSRPAGGGLFGGSPAAAVSAGGGGSLFGGGGGSGGAGGASFRFGEPGAASTGATPGPGKLFGGTGGGLFGGGAAAAAAAPAGAAPAEAEAAEDDEDENGFVKEEEVTAIHGWTPSITLEIADSIETGEEQEEELYCQRSKLYRFREEEWKERGLGEARLMKDKATGRVRFLLRQEKTGKVVANHYVLDHSLYCDLRPNATSDKIWVWSAQDYAEGQLEVERLALKFGSSELAGRFREAFEDAKARNVEALGAASK